MGLQSLLRGYLFLINNCSAIFGVFGEEAIRREFSVSYSNAHTYLGELDFVKQSHEKMLEKWSQWYQN
jgi:hypothetical protein